MTIHWILKLYSWIYTQRNAITQYKPSDYLAASWQIIDNSAFEDIFPDPSCAWVMEPSGTLHEYKNTKTDTSSSVKIDWHDLTIYALRSVIREQGYENAILDHTFYSAEGHTQIGIAVYTFVHGERKVILHRKGIADKELNIR